ncbi:MAG: TIGR04283 family arsenosugar biosynthesis glycosyltransferase [Bacillota bacterium]
MISVIVPTNNEEELLPLCLASVFSQQEDVEVIIVDGASEDNTVEIAKNYTEKVVIIDKADLPAQLNAGAARANGEILLFLHADCRLVPNCLKRLESISPGVAGGAFTMQLDGRRLQYQLLSMGGNFYCCLTGTYFGDRGIFVRAQVFRELGGFASMPIMADVEFSRRLNKFGQCKLLKGPVISSSRKFDREGPLRNLYLIFYALLAYRLGVDPEIIKEKYYHQ